MGFDGGLKKPPTNALCLIILDNACILCITVAAGTELADAYSPDIVIASSPGKEVHDPWAFYLHVALLHARGQKNARFNDGVPALEAMTSSLERVQNGVDMNEEEIDTDSVEDDMEAKGAVNCLDIFGEYVRDHCLDILVLHEMMVSGEKADKMVKGIGFDSSYRVKVKGFGCDIWVLWRNHVQLELSIGHSQFVHTKVRWGGSHFMNATFM
ncbi:hypothetical protein Gohar_013547 [Gossypium harknessii]|uniref:Uncharacterized protein n=1 Tax=Gossypium harknessii TaxID=34285 RepID=A0A7J9H0C9_9ROSI|nr:hypothetical protein [Gossypium harknessii]